MLVAGVLVGAALLLGRFVSGRVLVRGASPWDARYLTWAPPIPPEVTVMRGVAYPRSRWARRPGWHRQVVRLLAALLAVGAVVAPVVTIAAAGGAAVAGAAAAVYVTRSPVASAPGATTTGQGPGVANGRAHRMSVPTYVRPAYIRQEPEGDAVPLRVTAHRVVNGPAGDETRWW